MADFSDDELLSELGIDLAPVKSVTYTAKEERLISGFEEITRFYEEHKKVPSNTPDADIFERIYAVRLAQLKKSDEAIALLTEFDQYQLLSDSQEESIELSSLEDEDLLAELGIELEDEANVFVLQNVRTQKEREANELTANRKVCLDFDVFKTLFDQINVDIESGIRITKPFGKDATIELHDWFIVDGLIVYVAEIGKYFKAPNGENDARLRAIYSNGTESNLLMRSLKKALNSDKSSRRILVANNVEPLFNSSEVKGEVNEIEIKSGTIYVLRSMSENSFIKDHKEVIHKIGVTTGKVNKRITDAKNDPTYLLADVELVASYGLPENIVPHKLEKLIHKVLQSAQLDINIEDRFGKPVKPKEWFLVSIDVINQVIEHIKNGTVESVYYDVDQAQLINRA